jgi:hypothetical protein
VLNHGPAGPFLTDLSARTDTLFAVTANLNGGGLDARNEVRAYRWDGTKLTLQGAVQTPGFPPSFKQVAVARERGSLHVLVSEFQAGWLRSLLYAHDDD